FPAARIVLAPAAAVHVRVTTTAELGLPAPNMVRLFHGTGDVAAPAEGGIDGDFLFPEVQPGPVAVFVGVPHARGAVVRATAVLGEELRLAVALEPVGTITGRVVDPAGRPLQRARVDLEGVRKGRFAERSAETDADG